MPAMGVSRTAREGFMRSKMLADVLERVEAWPAEAQDQLAAIAAEMDTELASRDYQPTPEELSGIDRGLRAAAEGRFATHDQVEAAFARLRTR